MVTTLSTLILGTVIIKGARKYYYDPFGDEALWFTKSGDELNHFVAVQVPGCMFSDGPSP